MRVLAVGDHFIPGALMENGLSSLRQAGLSVEVREWKHENLDELQRDNLLIEQQGPEAVSLPENLFAGVEDYDIIIVQFTPLKQQVIEQARKLKLIGVLRGGVENIDVPYATKKCVAVANTPGRNARAVAEFTIGLIFAEVRNIARSHAALKAAHWRKDFLNSEEIPELWGKTVGLIGLGAVGMLVSRYLQAFGCKIIAYDPYVQQEQGIVFLGLEEVLRQADIVSVHARYTKETHHLISAKEIAMMKPSAILVNTARSGLVDQDSLVKALQGHRIRGAALDVFDVEPIMDEDEILKLDNITITSHLAGSTRDAFINSPLLFSSMLQKALSGGDRLSVVNGIDLSL